MIIIITVHSFSLCSIRVCSRLLLLFLFAAFILHQFNIDISYFISFYMCFIFLSFFSFTLSVVDKCSAHNSQHIIYHNHKRLLLMMCLCGSLCVVCGLVSESDISFALFMLLDILVTVVVVVVAACWRCCCCCFSFSVGLFAQSTQTKRIA